MKTKFILSMILLASFNNLFSQTHVITIHKNQRVASLELTPEEYASWIAEDGFLKWNPRVGANFLKEVYQKFKDEFDYVFFVLNESERPSTILYDGINIRISNNVTGIGLAISNFSSGAGSSGRLKSVMQLSRKDYILNGPTLHELMHNWGNYAIKTSTFFGTLNSDYRPHWGVTGGNTPGQLGGFVQSTLKTNVDGNPKKYQVGFFGHNANYGNSVPYNEMELYLMGMIPITSVTPFDVFRDITSFDFSTYTFTANTRVTYDQSRIISELGMRSPSWVDSQKDFRLLIIVLTDTPLTEPEWDLFDTQSEIFGRRSDDGDPNNFNFWEATGGRGTIETGNLNNALQALKLSVTPSNTDFGSKEGSTTIAITSNTNWSVSDDADWLTVSPVSGYGNGIVTATYSANTLPTSRIGIITFSATGISSQSVTLTQSDPTQVETSDDIKVSIYPNPTKDYITIIFGETILEDLSISISDVLGRSDYLIKNTSDNLNGEHTIDLSSLSKGLYIITLKNKDFSKNYKIVKE